MIYSNQLSVRHDGKTIPYNENHVDGRTNHGFKYLKGDPALLDSIPELVVDGSMKSIVAVLNDASNELFSIGCDSGQVEELLGNRYAGYIEIALNSKHGVADAQNYFPLFFHFDRYLLISKFQFPVLFNWELQPAHFFDSDSDGFTCVITINTGFFQTPIEAQSCWAAATAALTEFFKAVPKHSDDEIITTRRGQSNAL